MPFGIIIHMRNSGERNQISTNTNWCVCAFRSMVLRVSDVYLCQIVDKEQIIDTAFSITILCADLASVVRPGQFLHIKCGEDLLLRRPLSICNVFVDTLTVVFDVKGKGTQWLSQREPGDYINVLGPLGNGFNLPDGDIIVVGGGLGSPPMLFAADSANSGVTAILGFRDASRVMLVNDFKEVCDAVYITTDDGSVGIHGSVVVPLEKLLKKGGYDAVLTCGQHAMEHAVAELCKQYNIPCQVSLEERMGCGVGACLVCACTIVKNGEENMSRVCRDGPVFDATDVVW